MFIFVCKFKNCKVSFFKLLIMKNILVPVGNSNNVLSHVQYAIDFANSLGANVYLVQVYNVFAKAGTMVRVDDILEKEGLKYLNEIIEKVDTKSVNVIPRTFKGDLVATLELAAKKSEIDLILLEPRTTSIKDEVFLGKTSGKIIKKTNIPALIVPEGYKFKAIDKILMAVKSAVIKKKDALTPLKTIKSHFNANLNLLLVNTPYHKDGDFEVNNDLDELVNTKFETEGATTFQGVLKHYKSNDPDMLCVVRRKRGFFTKKWEKNTILKKDLHFKRPVLVLRGLK